jgi:hypothetical protein
VKNEVSLAGQLLDLLPSNVLAVVLGYLIEPVRLGINRATGEAKLYKIDRPNPMVKTITEFQRKLSMQIAEQEEARMKHPPAVVVAAG